MITGIALAALLIGGVTTAVTLNDERQAQDYDRAPVIEVQKVETVNAFED